MTNAAAWISRQWVIVLTMASTLLAACAKEAEVTAHSSLVGIYAPGNKIGAAAPMQTGGAGAETTSDAEIEGYFAVPPGDRCVGVPPGAMGSAGVLMAEFKTVPLKQNWGPANVGAVWIEDAAQNYVKTLELWAGVRKKSLYKWGKRACQMPEPDVVTRATLATPSEHKVMWTGRDLKGNSVPDGTYKLFIEVTETESDVGRTAVYDVPKGPMPIVLQPPDTEPHQGLKISYAPMP
jgi:hypothetical protein